MKILTAAQMREIDRRTIEAGIPGIVLMENAGHRVVEFLQARFAPLERQRVAILCGKGNNGGDGLVVARQLHTRLRPRELHVLLACDPAELKGDAAANYRMLEVAGCPLTRQITPEMRRATLVLDALLGTGLAGPASGRMLELIREINTGFPDATVVAVDIPSGLASDTGAIPGECVRALHTVTFTAPKIGQVMPPACDHVGELIVAPIGSPPEWLENDPALWLSLLGPAGFRRLFAPRLPGAHKGDFGHVLVVGGSRGKPGAAAMAGLAALRAGAGLVTVASAQSAVAAIGAHAAELMAEPLPETDSGAISLRAFEYGRFDAVMERKTILALGPGLGAHHETVQFVRELLPRTLLPVVIDADGLNALAGADPWPVGGGCILTPHPGEMSRLTGRSTAEVQAGRLDVARAFAMERKVTLVLKGQRTVIAFPDGRAWINPTGTPGMGSGGTGDILTGLIAGLVAQFPRDRDAAIAAAVWLHGRAGELGAAELGEKCLTATDLLRYLPRAMEECAHLPDRL